MITVYRATDGIDSSWIDVVEADKITVKSVWIGGVKCTPRVTDWQTYHPTWDDAHDHLLKKVIDRVAEAKRTLDDAITQLTTEQKKLDALLKMKRMVG